MSETCEALMFGDVPCEEQAVTKIVGGCRHEHIRTKWLCHFHVERLDKAFCGPCHDVDGHLCGITWTVLERV